MIKIFWVGESVLLVDCCARGETPTISIMHHSMGAFVLPSWKYDAAKSVMGVWRFCAYALVYKCKAVKAAIR